MKLYKKFFAAVLTAAMLLSLAFGSVFAADTLPERTLPEVPDGYDGYAVVTVEAFVLGFGYILQPTFVPFVAGDNLSALTDRALNNAGINYTYGGTIESGFYLTGIACDQLTNGTEIVIPDYLAPELEDNFGCYNDDGDDWYNPENGDGILSQQEYTYYSGWMIIDDNVALSVGADAVTVEEGHVYRWMYSIYGWGMDIGINDGFGMFAPFDNPSTGVDRDEATALYAEITADPQLSAMVAEGGAAHDEYVAFTEALIDLECDQAAINAAFDALQAALGSGAVIGDVDGDGVVSMSDALMILRHAMSVIQLNGDALSSADMDGNGDITVSDAVMALRITLGLV